MAWFKRQAGADGTTAKNASAKGAGSQSVGNAIVLGSVTQISSGGDAYFYGDNCPFVLEPFASAAAALDVAKARQAPSRLLRASQQTVPFTGRDPELAGLSAWRDEPGQCSVRLVHGPAGQGKTRLLAAFAESCAADGWQVVAARLTPLAEGAAELGTARRLLVVADHAERWPADDLLALVRRLLRLRYPVRVLLASRPAGGWWASLQTELDDMSVAAAATSLSPLGEQADRSELFAAARDSFAAALGVSDAAEIAPPATLDQAGYESVLTVHMAALAAVSARIDGGQAPADPAAISAYLLTRERVQWRKLYERKAVQTSQDLMGQAVFTAILTRPVSDRFGTQALIRAGVVAAVDTARRVLTDHRFCYPPADTATVLEPLHPDRLGEDFLALQTPGSGWTGYDPDPWADHAVDDLLSFAEGTDPPPWARAAMTVLAAAAERWPHLQRRLSDLVRDNPRLATEAGGRSLAAIAELPGIDMAALEAIERHLPADGGTLDLNIGIAGVAARLTAHRFEATDKPAEQAALMLALAAPLENAGHRQDAYAAVFFAASTYGALAQQDPGSYQPELARSLLELGRLSDDPRSSLAASQEAAEMLRPLAADDPGRYEPHYARALNNVANRHPDRAEALRAGQESVAIIRRLAQADPAAYEPEYTTSLGTLALRQAALGQSAAALTTAGEALEIAERLAAADRAAHEPQLAMLLNNRGQMAGTPRESLAATSRAVEIFRRLAAANPPKYDPQLAGSLDNLSLRYGDLKQDADARAAAAAAVAIWERLTEADMVRYEPRLAAESLKFARLCAASRVDLPAAKRAADQALAIYQRMRVTQPGLVFTDYEQVQCRFVGADILDGLGQSEEAARIRKSLTDNGWQPYHP